MIPPTDPRELTPEELDEAEKCADRLYSRKDVRLPETLRAAYWLKLLVSSARKA